MSKKKKLKESFDDKAIIQNDKPKNKAVVTSETCDLYHAVGRAQKAYFKKIDECNNKAEKDISQEDHKELERLKKKRDELFEKFRSNMGSSSH